MKRIVTILLLASAPASAQVVCTRNYGQVICNDIGRSFDQLGNALEEYGQNQLTRRVGQLVAEGDCDGAKSLALENGNFALASQAVQLCTPATPPPQPPPPVNKQIESIRAYVGRLVDENKCSEAKDLATRWDQHDLVAEVGRRCG
jgi:hypothetical protein